MMQVLAILTEHQDLAFAIIKYVNVFSSVKVYVHWLLKLAWTITTMCAKCLYKVQVGVKHLYSAIVAVTHIDLVVMVSDTIWMIKLPTFLPSFPTDLTTSPHLLNFVNL